MLKKIRHSLGPLFLILVCPPFAILLWFTNTALAGSFASLWSFLTTQGFVHGIYQIWRPVMFGSPLAWIIILSYAAFQLLIMRCLPGKIFYGPITPKGNVPVYKANGVLAFATTMVVFSVLTFGLHIFPAALIYDNFGAILGALNVASLVFCLFLYAKGCLKPSSSDAGVTGNALFDYYWGTELYPRVWGFDLKTFITCRFGMMSWGVILLSYAAKQQVLYGLADSMLVSCVLQFVYLTKFYFWETGYWRSLDIMHDRAGFYICWGCMVWVPCVYTSPAMYLVLHPVHLGIGLASAITLIGTLSILMNYFADRQRQLVRATGGDCKVWGKSPRLTLATYQTTTGEVKQNILLSSGWWGIARHFHYVPELIGAFCWSLPALFTNFAPYFYVTFLSALLFDRAFRDDQRCALKYGSGWDDYCKLVPYKILPFVI